MADSPRRPGDTPRTDRSAQLAAALVLLATVALISAAVVLTDTSRSVIAWAATASLLLIAVIFVQRR